MRSLRREKTFSRRQAGGKARRLVHECGSSDQLKQLEGQLSEQQPEQVEDGRQLTFEQEQERATAAPADLGGPV